MRTTSEGRTVLTETVDTWSRALAALLAAGPAARDVRRLTEARRSLDAVAGQVPALRPLAEAAARLAKVPPAQAPRALLDAVALTERVRVSLAGHGVAGALEPLPPSGPWRTPADAAVVAETVAVWRGRGARRLAVLRDARAHGDLRLLPLLLPALGDSYTELAQLVAGEVLPAYGPAIVEDLRRVFDARGGATDARRLTVLASIDKSHRAALFEAAFAEGSVPVRAAALLALGASSPKRGRARAIEVLQRKGPLPLQVAALSVLEQVGPTPPDVPFLIDLFADERHDLYARAEQLLGRVGRAAVPALLTLFRQATGHLTLRILWLLRELGPEAAEAVPALHEALSSPTQWVPHNACSALGAIGPAARAAVPDLVARLTDVDVQLRIDAALAVFRITGKHRQAVPVLIAALGAANASAARDAAEEHGRPFAPEAVHVAAASAARDAAEALGLIGPAAREAVPVLVAILRDRRSPIQHFAATALGRIGQKAAEVVPLLIACLDSDRYYVREAAVEALGCLGPRARAALPALRRLDGKCPSCLQEPLTAALAAIEGTATGGTADAP